MIIQKIVYRDREIALVEGCDPIADGQSALDLMAAVWYETGCDGMALLKEAPAPCCARSEHQNANVSRLRPGDVFCICAQLSARLCDRCGRVSKNLTHIRI